MMTLIAWSAAQGVALLADPVTEPNTVLKMVELNLSMTLSCDKLCKDPKTALPAVVLWSPRPTREAFQPLDSIRLGSRS